MSTDVKPVVAPNLPIAPSEYLKQHQDQFANALRLFFASITNAINSPKPYGSFYDTTTQTNPVANVARAMKLSTTVDAWGVTLSNDRTRIYVGTTGVYNVQFSVQADKAGGSADALYIWLRKNGQDVPFSASKVIVNGPNDEKIPAWNFVIPLATNDYIELMWSSPDTNMILAATTASTPVPAIPSVIITVTWASNSAR